MRSRGLVARLIDPQIGIIISTLNSHRDSFSAGKKDVTPEVLIK